MHSLPVGQMGNYQEYLKRFTPPLREIESIPVRQHMFGNPFKIDKVRPACKSQLSFSFLRKKFPRNFVTKNLNIKCIFYIAEDDGG